MSTAAETEHTTIVFCALTFNLVLCYPQSIYISFKLYRNWNQIYFIKRRRFLTLCLVIFTVFFQLVTSQFVIWEEFYYETYKIDLISTYAGHAVTFCFVILYTTRMWCLHYDHQMYQISNHKSWHCIINNTHFENNWYIKHRSTWGNDKWLMCRIGTPIFIVCSFLHVALHILMYGTSQVIVKDVVTLLLTLCFVLIGIALWTEFPKLGDTILIRKELKMCVLIMAGGIIAFIAVTFTVGGFSILFVPMTVNMLLLHVIVLYPIHNVRTHSRSTVDNVMASAKSWLSFVNICDVNYNAFMSFLAREFSIENLLFLTEYVQLKEYIVGTLNMIEVQAQVQGYCDALCLPQCSEFPVSDIVTKYEESIAHKTLDGGTCFMHAVTSLYKKYVWRGTATHEINISYSVHNAIRISIFGNKINTKMSDQTIMATIQSDSAMSDSDLSKKMIQILRNFEGAADEVSRLLTSSFSRFKYQSEE
eukprot:332952_1